MTNCCLTLHTSLYSAMLEARDVAVNNLSEHFSVGLVLFP